MRSASLDDGRHDICKVLLLKACYVAVCCLRLSLHRHRSMAPAVMATMIAMTATTAGIAGTDSITAEALLRLTEFTRIYGTPSPIATGTAAKESESTRPEKNSGNFSGPGTP